VVITALVVMVALVLFGVGFGGLFAATNCRQLRPIDIDASTVAPATSGPAAVAAALADAGVDEEQLAAAASLFGPAALMVPVPLGSPLRLGGRPEGLLITGDGAVLIAPDGQTLAGVTFRRPVTVVGDGSAVFALVVGNVITGQVDALRPLTPGADGFSAGTCVDTSAVGSPLSFLHDARDGTMLGLRTDEDGTDAVLELRDPLQGRAWAPVVELPRAPAGLQGARTSGAIGPDAIVMARRFGRSLTDPTVDDVGSALWAFDRRDGGSRWRLDPVDVRAALPSGLARIENLRLEVAHVDLERALITVAPDVPVDAPLPLPVHGPLGHLSAPDPMTVTLEVALDSGTVLRSIPGAAPVGRDGPTRGRLVAALSAIGLDIDDVFQSDGRTWVLMDRMLVRFG